MHCEGALVLSLPLTQGNGSLPRWPILTVPNDPGFTGMELTNQAFFYDPNQSGLPISGTNGVVVKVPAPHSLGSNVHRLTLSGSSSGAQGSVLYGDAAVVRFE
jgi:hypothetical protein